MKTKIALIIAAALLLTGCSTASFNQKLSDFDALGVSEVEIAGKFSHTRYLKTEAEGKVTSTLEHTNAWVPKVRIVRTRPAQQ